MSVGTKAVVWDREKKYQKFLKNQSHQKWYNLNALVQTQGELMKNQLNNKTETNIGILTNI